MLTAARLRERMIYDPETGIFIHRVGCKGTAAGTIAGACMQNGRRLIGIDRCRYLSYRLAWLYMTGEWPASDIDHINGAHDDDRFANLREATKSQNLANAKRPCTNTSGFKGVSWNKNAKKWRSLIKRDRKVTHIGYFATAEEAHAAYVAKATELFGDFARAA